MIDILIALFTWLINKILEIFHYQGKIIKYRLYSFEEKEKVYLTDGNIKYIVSLPTIREYIKLYKNDKIGFRIEKKLEEPLEGIFKWEFKDFIIDMKNVNIIYDIPYNAYQVQNICITYGFMGSILHVDLHMYVINRPQKNDI